MNQNNQGGQQPAAKISAKDRVVSSRVAGRSPASRNRPLTSGADRWARGIRLANRTRIPIAAAAVSRAVMAVGSRCW